MTSPRSVAPRRKSLAAMLLLGLAVLAGCGGGGGNDAVSEDCSAAGQKAWLRDWMSDWYFWYRLSPNPDPAAFASVGDYYKALLYAGTDPAFPRDRWSGSESTEVFNRFFGDGQTLGYGMAVAGLEVTGRPDQPLWVRHVEARSPAAAQGVQRGDRVLALNGRSAADLIAVNDFSLLTARNSGDQLTVLLRTADGRERSVVLAASVFSLTPVPQARTLVSPGGRRLGYVVVKDMVNQVGAPLEAAFAQFRAEGVQDLVIDLRYNGGGLVAVAGQLASFVSAGRAGGQVFARLLYNDRQAARNQSVLFGRPAAALELPRVYLLAGERTCSASEQVINGLRPFLDVIVIGDTTCGKPVGFLPAGYCGTTYSAVNFESVNARQEGRYFDGFDPSCPVAEDFRQPLGSPAEPLLAAAARHADTGLCPAFTTADGAPASGRDIARRAPRRPDGAVPRSPAEQRGEVWR